MQDRILFRTTFQPAGNQSAVLPKHALSGAWCVYQNFIKKTSKPCQQLLRSLRSHTKIRTAPHGQIFQKCFCTACAHIICHKKPTPFQTGGQLRSLSPGSCTQIQYPVPRLYRKSGCRKHRTRLLYIIQAGIIIRMLCGLLRLFDIKSFPGPRDRPKCKWHQCLKFLHGELSGIHPQPGIAFLFIACQKRLILVTQLFFHPIQKLFR